MLDRLIHRQPLRCRLLAGHDDVHIVPASETVISHRQQCIAIGRKIDTHHVGFLVHDMIDKPWILMAEAVVVLPPYVGTQ
jgi:hypothetical protein